MEAYRLITKSKEGAVKVGKNEYLIKDICTEREEKSIFIATLSWMLIHEHTWSCEAENDGGIDDTKVSKSARDLDPSSVVVSNGSAVGYFDGEILFRFDEAGRCYRESESDLGTVACWGSISESDCDYIEKNEVARVYSFKEDSEVVKKDGAIIVDGVLISHECKGGTLVVPEGVRAIAGGLFSASNIVTLVLPEGLTEIGERAFSSAKSLVSVHLPSTLQTIGECAFLYCESLASVTIPASVEKIDEYAFGASGLESVIFEKDFCGEIGKKAFRSCERLSEISFPEKLDYIGAEAFFGCSSLLSVTLPTLKNGIGYSAFADCECLKEITLPEGLTTICEELFQNCKSLEHVSIPEGVTKINQAAFRGCKALKEITLPTTLKTLDKYAFENCESLEEVTLPDSIKEIPFYLFRGCSSLKTVHIPKSVAEYGYESFSGTRIESFAVLNYAELSDCTVRGMEFLHELIIGERAVLDGYYPIKEVKALKRVVFLGERDWLPDGIFTDCPELTEIVFPKGLEEIPRNILKNCTSIREVILPPTVTTVDWWAFVGCTSLESIVFPESISSVILCLEDFESLKTLYYPGDPEKLKECFDMFDFPEGVVEIKPLTEEHKKALEIYKD